MSSGAATPERQTDKPGKFEIKNVKVQITCGVCGKKETSAEPRLAYNLIWMELTQKTFPERGLVNLYRCKRHIDK